MIREDSMADLVKMSVNDQLKFSKIQNSPYENFNIALRLSQSIKLYGSTGNVRSSSNCYNISYACRQKSTAVYLETINVLDEWSIL